MLLIQAVILDELEFGVFFGAVSVSLVEAPMINIPPYY